MSRPSDDNPTGVTKTPSYSRYRFQTNFQPKSLNKPSRYFADPRIVPRVRQYLEENKDKYFIDFYDMVTELQNKYKEYRRRKRCDFKALVEKAFTVVLESYEKKGALQPGGDDSSNSDVSDMELIAETIVEENNVANQQMLSLYSKDGYQNSSGAPAMYTDEEKVINLSSDEEDVEVREDPKAKRFKQDDVPASIASDVSNIKLKDVPKAPTSLDNEDVSVTIHHTGRKKIHKPTCTPNTKESVQEPAVKETSTVTPAAVPDAPSRLKRCSRKRARNPEEQTVQQDKTEKTNRQTNKTDLPVRTPTYNFQDIGGCTKVLQEVCKLLIHIRHPEVYAQVGVSPPRGFLLHGPPGCGKTLLAGAIAGELKIPLLKVSGPELIAGVSGESEERIRNLFDQAVSIAPCVLFLDEVDAISPNRSTAQREMERRIVAQLLSCLDDLGEQENGNRVLVVGATNRPDSLDPALRRAGRFDREVCLGIPDRAARAQILRVVCKNLSLDPEVASDEGMDYLASITPGFVGADLKALTREAAMVAINRIFTTLQNDKPEEVEMVDATEDISEVPTVVEKAAEEKVENVPMQEAAPEIQTVESKSVPSEPPGSVVITEVKEVEVNDIDIQDNSIDNIIIEEEEEEEEEEEDLIEEVVVVDPTGANSKSPSTEDIEIETTTECVDLEIDEQLLPDGRQEDGATISVVTPDSDRRNAPLQVPSENGVTVKDVNKEVETAVATGPPQDALEEEILPDDVPEQIVISEIPPQAAPVRVEPLPIVLPQVVPQVTPVVVPQVDGVAPQVVLPEVAPQVVLPEVAPQVVLPQVAPQVVLPQVAPQVVLPQVAPQVVLPQVAPQVAPQVVLPQVAPQVVLPEVAPQVAPQVAPVTIPQVIPAEGVPPQVVPQITPEGVVPQVVSQDGVPQVLPQVIPQNIPAGAPPQSTEAAPAPKAEEDSVMVVEEVEGMGLTQKVPGTTNWSAELNELITWLRDSPPLTADQLNGLNVNLDDFREALRHVQPSAKREGFATVPDVTWDDVGSLGNVRAELQLAILAPVRYPDQFERLGITSPTGVLLCGPPGCGKTLLAKAIANEAGVNFISVKGPELLNMYVGESERAVRQVFQRARNSAPCVIFFDELDSLCPRRSENSEGNVSSRVVNQLLTEMDGVESRSSVFLMAATNRPDILDPAVLRPGRLDKILYVGLPKAADRYDILRALTKNGTKPVLSNDVDLAQIAQFPACEGYSGADLAALVREAGVQALREFVTTAAATKQDGGELAVASRHFAAAISKVRPSVSEKEQKHYETLRRFYSSIPQRGEDTMDTT